MADGQAKQNEKIVMRVSFYSMATNIALSIFKVLAGFLAHSGAMVSDGIHSASDVFSTVVVMVWQGRNPTKTTSTGTSGLNVSRPSCCQ